MDFRKGQHFLINEDILNKEISVAEISDKDYIIEIGAGKGNLTKKILLSGAKVVCFEIEKKFFDDLRKLEKKYDNLKVIYDDCLKYDWSYANIIVSNIPYHLSEAIIIKCAKEKIERMVFIVGEKFKEKLVGVSKIGLIVRIFYNIETVLKVNKKKFFPVPRVDSWLVVFENKKKRTKEERIIKNIILYRGKLKNGILFAFIKEGFSKKKSRELIKKMNFSEGILEKKCSKISYRFLERLKNNLDMDF